MGVDLEDLWAPRFINAVCELFVQDSMHEKEMLQHRDSLRAIILQRTESYNSDEQFGMSNDDHRPAPMGPLPNLPPLTEMTTDGYVGLDPPVGG